MSASQQAIGSTVLVELYYYWRADSVTFVVEAALLNPATDYGFANQDRGIYPG